MNLPLSSRILPAVALVLASAGTLPAADIYWDGVTNSQWSAVASWSDSVGGGTDPAAPPGASDIARFSITGATAATLVLLDSDQAAQGLVYANGLGTVGIRASVFFDPISLEAVSLTLGASGLSWGTTQVDLGNNGGTPYTIKLAANQSWNNTSGTAAGTLLQSFATITNAGDVAPVTLSIDGTNAANKNFFGSFTDSGPTGTLAIVINNGAATFGNTQLLGNNTYSGGTTLTNGFLQLSSDTALGTGPLVVGGGATTPTISSGKLGGITLANNNAITLNSNVNLVGAQSLNFGTGNVVLTANRTLNFNANGNSPTFTFGGSISGAGFSLTTTTTSTGPVNSMLNLEGGATGNTYDGGTIINQNIVRFANLSAIPATGNITLGGGGALAVSGAHSTIADWFADARLIANTGAMALAADSSEDVNYVGHGTLSLGAQLGSVAKYTGTYTPAGTFYQIGGGGGTIIFPKDNTFTGARGVLVSTGGGGIGVISGQNNYTGQTQIGVGIVEVSSINSVIGGSATSNLGAPSSVANGTILIGGASGSATLRYLGPGESTDRDITLASGFSGGGAALDASGTGALVFTGLLNQGNYTGTANGNRTFTLRGVNTEANSFAGAIVNSAPNGSGFFATTAVTKTHRGSWTLTGASTTTGAIALNGGTLTLDYATNQILPVAATNAVTFGGATLAIKGIAAGNTAQAFGNLTLTANTGQNQLTVTGNGPDGSAVLTLGNTWTRNANAYFNINLATGGRVTSNPAQSSGVVVGSGTVAAFTVTDAAGTDFATVTGGNLAKLGAATALPDAVGSATTNYVLAGDLAFTGAVSANTVRIDTAGATGTLTLGTSNLTVARTTLLKTGANPYTITGARLAPNNGTIGLATFGAGTLIMNAAITAGTGSVVKTGPGLLDVNVSQFYTGATSIYGGVWRMSAPSSIGSGNIALSTGGIIELASTDFTRAIGTGGNQIQWQNGDGGFSAFGGNRVVNLGGAGAQMVWGSLNNGIVTAPFQSPNFIKDGQALLLSSPTSDSTIEFANAIDLVNAPRVIDVANGSAAVDARLSGALTASGNGALFKTGAGTLAISGAQSYPTLVADAGLTLLESALGTGGSTLKAYSAVEVSASQTLEALIIGDGGVVTLTAAPAPEAFVDGGFFSAPESTAGGGWVQPVPEPGSAVLLMTGMLALLRRRRA